MTDNIGILLTAAVSIGTHVNRGVSNPCARASTTSMSRGLVTRKLAREPWLREPRSLFVPSMVSDKTEVELSPSAETRAVVGRPKEVLHSEVEKSDTCGESQTTEVWPHGEVQKRAVIGQEWETKNPLREMNLATQSGARKALYCQEEESAAVVSLVEQCESVSTSRDARKWALVGRVLQKKNPLSE